MKVIHTQQVSKLNEKILLTKLICKYLHIVSCTHLLPFIRTFVRQYNGNYKSITQVNTWSDFQTNYKSILVKDILL